MKYAYYAAISLGWTMIICGLPGCFSWVHADIRKDAVCVTMLNPATCKSAGDSLCNWLAGDPVGKCGGECWYCDTDTKVPERSCVDLAEENCKTTGDVVPCATSNRKKGLCQIDQSCLCLNVSTIQPNCQNIVTYPCEDL